MLECKSDCLHNGISGPRTKIRGLTPISRILVQPVDYSLPHLSNRSTINLCLRYRYSLTSMALTELLVVLSMAYGGSAVAITSRMSLQKNTAAMPARTSLASPVTAQRNPLRKPFTWQKNPKYKPFTAEVSTTRTEAMFNPRDTYMTIGPHAEGLVGISRTIFNRQPLATSATAEFRWRPCCKSKRPCKGCPPKSPCKAFTEMPSSPHKRESNMTYDAAQAVEASSSSTGLLVSRIAVTGKDGGQLKTSGALKVQTNFTLMVPLPSQAAQAACAGGRCHWTALPITTTDANGNSVVTMVTAAVRDITLPTLSMVLDVANKTGGFVRVSMKARSALPEPGFVAKPAPLPSLPRIGGPTQRATRTAMASAALLPASSAAPSPTPEPSAATPEASSAANAVTTRGLFPPPCPIPVIPKVKTTTTTTTTTTATTTVTVANKPFLPPPKVISCPDGCCRGGCPWVRSPRLVARGLPEGAPTSYPSSAAAFAPSSVLSVSSRRNAMYHARASSDAESPSGSAAPSPSPSRTLRTTTIFSTTWTETTVTTILPPTRSAASRTARAAAAGETTAVRKSPTPMPSPTSGASVAGASVGLFTLLGAFWLAVVA